MKFEIVTYGDPILRVKAAPVDRVTADLKRLIDDMLETMYAGKGVGLAAQQVGRTTAVCVIDVPPASDAEDESGPRLNPQVAMPLVLFNPVIVARAAAQQRGDEGCLSFPGIHTPVGRAAEVTVEFMDLRGERRALAVRGLVARAVQHELDHLHGVLLVDRMSPVKRISLAGQLRRLKEQRGWLIDSSGHKG
jgi:peptide deformylase